MTRVLVVDDDEVIRNVLVEALTDEGFEVAEAGDGRQALERAAAWRPEVILLDLMMPRMDGWAFRAAQREDEALRRVPVIILSAARELEKHVAELRPAAAVAKPFNIVALLETIEQVLASSAD